jgi:hypothetical protein
VRGSGSFCSSRQPRLGPVIAPSQAQNPGFIAISRHRAKTNSMVHSSMQAAQTACLEPRLSSLIWMKFCLMRWQRHSRLCQCAHIGYIGI